MVLKEFHVGVEFVDVVGQRSASQQPLLLPIMIRRTKDCKIDGHYIVNLPQKEILT